MVVIFLRAFDLLFGLRKGEPMFRRLVPLWVIVSTILAGGSARAQMPFPVDLVPNRTALERLGLERQWFGVIPLVETERLMKITLSGDLTVCPDRLRHGACVRRRVGAAALVGSTRGTNRLRTRRHRQLVRGLRDQRQHSPCSRQENRQADLEITTWARSRPARRPAMKIGSWSD